MKGKKRKGEKKGGGEKGGISPARYKVKMPKRDKELRKIPQNHPVVPEIPGASRLGGEKRGWASRKKLQF